MEYILKREQSIVICCFFYSCAHHSRTKTRQLLKMPHCLFPAVNQTYIIQSLSGRLRQIRWTVKGAVTLLTATLHSSTGGNTCRFHTANHKTGRGWNPRLEPLPDRSLHVFWSPTCHFCGKTAHVHCLQPVKHGHTKTSAQLLTDRQKRF